jgi:hypothetical protein
VGHVADGLGAGLAGAGDHVVGGLGGSRVEQGAPQLGARVGLSRTRFFERFTELVGEPPARYVARWRVHAATDLMRRQGLSTAQVAERVGYASEDAFTRVFKRHLGGRAEGWVLESSGTPTRARTTSGTDAPEAALALRDRITA